jgi:hypothetical protein
MDFKKIIPHAISLMIMIIVSFICFYPQFQNKVVPQGDIVNWKGMSQELLQHEKRTGEVSMWTNSIFSGMPAYQIYSPSKGNFLKWIEKGLGLWFNAPAGYFILGMISFYILMFLLGVNHWLALGGALLFGLSTNNFILFEAGHTSKIRTIMLSPLIIAGLLLVFRKSYLTGFAVFTVGMGLNINANHLQMTYYLGLVLIVLTTIELIKAIKDKDYSHIIKGGALLVLGSILALGSSSSRILTTYEYAKDTMRGKPILESRSGQTQSSSEVDGLDWDYAMQWSNGTMDLFASFIPQVVGGGSAERVGKNSAFKGMVRPGDKLPTYWGSLPFTSGPIYFGALAFFLFLFGAFAVRSTVKWWLVIAVALTFMWSMGKNLEFFNTLFFDYFPFFNKFRTPNSVLSITVLLIPILGILGLHELIKSENRHSFLRSLYISGGIMAGICLIFGLFGPGIFDFSAPGDSRFDPNIAGLFQEDRASMLRSSSLRSLFFISIGIGTILLFIKNKITPGLLISVLLVFGSLDLLMLSKRYLGPEDFISERQYAAQFQPRPVDEAILKDPDIYYRVLDLTVNTFNDARTSFHHKTIGGYHAAKLQRYQDLIDYHISSNNMDVLNMLNTKYFIVQGDNEQITYQINPAALGNAWFVENVKMVDNANEEIEALNEIDPASTAVVHQEFQDKLEQKTFNPSGSIKLTNYAPNKLIYQSESTDNQLAVFSEMWYGTDKGWVSYIDGKETEHFRVNYVLRGMNIPAGKHQIVFEFKPKAYYMGKKIAMASSSVILLILGFALFKSYQRKITS